MNFRLHNFFRSSTSTRVRIALNLKGLKYEYLSYALRKGETRTPEYLAINPAGLVPTLECDNKSFLNQSLAIMEWLNETHPDPPLLPSDAEGRVTVRSLAYMIACEIHPINNLRVLFQLRDQFGADEEAQKKWFIHWVFLTFDAIEEILAKDSRKGEYCYGDSPTMADICLYAQVWNNRRFQIPLEKWHSISKIYERLDALPAFRQAAPPNQPDAT